MIKIYDPAAALAFNRKLRLSKYQTKELQKALGAKPDGALGPKTTQAVAAFQAVNDLESDGLFGPSTQYEIGKSHPLACRDDPDEKFPNPALTEEIFAFAKREGLHLAIDIYHANPTPDFRALRASGFVVAGIKVNQNRGALQRNVKTRLEAMREAGLLTFGYTFGSASDGSERHIRKDGIGDAHAYAKRIAELEPFDLPHQIDLESGPLDTPREHALWLEGYISVPLPPTNYDSGRPMLYSGAHYFRSDMGGLEGYPVLQGLERWIARYPFNSYPMNPKKRPTLDKWPEGAKMWQLTSNAAHPSISRNGQLKRFDLNLIASGWHPALLPFERKAGCES